MARSTPSPILSDPCCIPYRIDLAGGWLDQPFVSKFYPGSVITISIEPTIAFDERSGMATSTRRSAIDLWGNHLPEGDPAKIARLLFCYDNPPGTVEISGSQDSIGIAMPGLNKADYAGNYWPERIIPLLDEVYLQFVQDALYLVPLGPRADGYAVLYETHIDRPRAQALAEAADACWQAILDRDLHAFGRAMRASFEAQIAMFPSMVNDGIFEVIAEYRSKALGWKLSGAGGGGYLVIVAERPIEGAIRIVARR